MEYGGCMATIYIGAANSRFYTFFTSWGHPIRIYTVHNIVYIVQTTRNC